MCVDSIEYVHQICVECLYGMHDVWCEQGACLCGICTYNACIQCTFMECVNIVYAYGVCI